MEKKYLMLLPLALPLFLGGKAAVTAIRRKSAQKSNGASLVRDGVQSHETAILDSDEHSDKLRSALQSPDVANPQDVYNFPDENEIERPDESQIDIPDEEEIQPPDEEVPPPGKTSDLIAGGEDPRNKILTGPKGGKYFINEYGKKIYLKK